MKLRATLVAVLIACIGGVLLWTYLKRFEAEASGGIKVGVLATIRTLEPGAVLKDEDIAERWIPQSYVESRAIRIGDRQRITNLRLSAPLQAQQTLMWTDIVVPNDDKTDVGSKLQQGMRAVTIRTESKIGALVKPGDRVDVIGIFSPKGADNDTRTGVVLLQNVLVLGRGAGEENRAAIGAPDANDLVLSLSLQNAQILSVAADRGKLSVAIRGRDDTRIQDRLADFPSTFLVEWEKHVAAMHAPKTGPININAPGQR